MPLPRFQKLPEPKQRAILDAAVDEFSAHGYEQASFNRIIETAGISKGAIYYYFADKEDLYLTAVERVIGSIGGQVAAFERPHSAPAFWRVVRALCERVIELVRQDPRVLRLVQRTWADLDRAMASKALAPALEASSEWMRDLIECGQKVGAVRTDLAFELLIDLVFAVSEVCDRYLLQHGELGTAAGRARAADRMLDLFRRLLAPGRTRKARVT